MRKKKSKLLGWFDTLDDAVAAYRKAKRAHILAVASSESDIRVKLGLCRHAENLYNGNK